VDMASRVLEVKKGNGVVGVERVIKFKAMSSSSSRNEEDKDDSTVGLVARLLTWLVDGFMVKNKVARRRCVQMISHLGEIEYVIFILCECTTDVSNSEDMNNDLRDALMECWRLSFAHTHCYCII